MKRHIPPYNGFKDRDDEARRWGDPPANLLDVIMGVCILGVLITLALAA